MRRTIPLFGMALLAAIAMPSVIAQTVDGLDLAAIRKRVAEQADEAAALAEQVKSRGDDFRSDAEAVRSGGMTAMQRARDLGPNNGPIGTIDFDEIISGAALNASGARGEAPQLIVFASLSLPPATLRPLIADTARAGGVIVFRGFPGNSARRFTTELARSVGDVPALANIGIDPRLFRAFSVEAVPTIVAVSSDFDLCAGLSCKTEVPPHDRITGNVTLDYALSTLADGGGAGARVAAVGLGRLRRDRP